MKQSDILDLKRIESWMKSSLSSKVSLSLPKWFENKVFDFQFESPGHQHVYFKVHVRAHSQNSP